MNKKRRSLKRKPVRKTKSSEKISLLIKRKDVNDKFFDLVQANVKNVPYKGVFKTKGITSLARELEVTPRTLKKYITTGKIKENNDQLVINIERNFEKLKIKKTKKQTGAYYVNETIPINFNFKKVTKEFTIHNFTYDNFFNPKEFYKKGFDRAKKKEMFFYKAGLYIVFERVKKQTVIEIKKGREPKVTMKYVIQNFPVSYYSSVYYKGFKEFFEFIKLELQQYPSLKYFRFNYFNIEKIDISK